MPSEWNHNVCWQCWVERNTEKDGRLKLPVRVIPDVDPGEEGISVLDIEGKCCYCGHTNIEGIYLRENPDSMPCKGVH